MKDGFLRGSGGRADGDKTLHSDRRSSRSDYELMLGSIGFDHPLRDREFSTAIELQ